MTGNQIDLLVIGEGLSGITAAAAAAGQGLRVMLVSTGPGTFVLGTAGVDLDGLATRDPGFAKYDADEIEEAIAFFAELSASAGFVFQGGLRDRRLVPTIMGTFQTVSMAPHSLWKGDPRGLAKVVVAGIEAMSGFDAAFVADRLYLHSRQMNLNTSYRGAVVRLPEDRRHALTAVEVADHVDRDPAYGDALVAALKNVVHDAELLIIPGILGMKSGDDDIRQFEEDIGCPVCELSTMPPSVPGLRLLRRFERRLIELGVEVCTGFSVQKLCLENGQCTGIILDTPGRPRRILADAVVLACGRFSRLLKGASEDQLPPRVTEELQPVSRNGQVIARNLYECGSVLGESEPRHGNAIAILSGYRAAMLASKQGVQYAGR
jgi:glycerol-3-phosphate dehydrogenase subunit B